MKKMVCFVLISLSLYGCSSVNMNVRSYNDTGNQIHPGATYATVELAKQERLEERQYLNIISDYLKSKGYSRSENNPDFIVTVSFSDRLDQHYEPPKTISIPQYNPGSTTYHSGYASSLYGNSAFYSGTSTSSGTWTTEQMTVGGGVETYHSRFMVISIFSTRQVDYAINNNQDIVPIWKGEAFSQGDEHLAKVAPCLVKGILEEFPKSSNTERSSSMDECQN